MLQIHLTLHINSILVRHDNIEAVVGLTFINVLRNAHTAYTYAAFFASTLTSSPSIQSSIRLRKNGPKYANMTETRVKRKSRMMSSELAKNTWRKRVVPL